MSLSSWLDARGLQAAEGPLADAGIILLEGVQRLEADDLEASQSSLSFLHSYVGRLRKLLPSAQQLAEHETTLEQLLVALARKSLYPDDFCFEHEDEAEATFLAYRRELATLFKGVARLHGKLAQDFVARLLQSATKVAGVPWAHLEVVLWLLYHLGEGLPEAAQKGAGPLQAAMEGLVGFGASTPHHHQAVQILYLELLVRYYRFFLATPTHLGTAFHSFLDERGIYNARRDVRAKACYLLLRFVKHTLKASSPAVLDAIISRLLALLLLQQQPAHTLTSAPDGLVAPTAATAAGALGGAPAVPPNGIAPAAADGHGGGGGGGAAGGPRLQHEEQMHLYEACGVLLGAGLVPPARVGELLCSILQLPLQQLQALCAQSAQHAAAVSCGGGLPGESVEQLLAAGAAAAAQNLAVVAVISKGFSNLAASDKPEQHEAQRPVRPAGGDGPPPPGLRPPRPACGPRPMRPHAQARTAASAQRGGAPSPPRSAGFRSCPSAEVTPRVLFLHRDRCARPFRTRCASASPRCTASAPSASCAPRRSCSCTGWSRCSATARWWVSSAPRCRSCSRPPRGARSSRSRASSTSSCSSSRARSRTPSRRWCSTSPPPPLGTSRSSTRRSPRP